MQNDCWEMASLYYADCKPRLGGPQCMHYRESLHAGCNCFVPRNDIDSCWKKCDQILQDCGKDLSAPVCFNYKMQCTKQCNEGCKLDIMALKEA